MARFKEKRLMKAQRLVDLSREELGLCYLTRLMFEL